MAKLAQKILANFRRPEILKQTLQMIWDEWHINKMPINLRLIAKNVNIERNTLYNYINHLVGLDIVQKQFILGKRGRPRTYLIFSKNFSSKLEDPAISAEFLEFIRPSNMAS